jgi:hypothetical protein
VHAPLPEGNCGSGTTATVAEQWGRRWITIDTSRVALALAAFDAHAAELNKLGPLTMTPTRGPSGASRRIPRPRAIQVVEVRERVEEVAPRPVQATAGMTRNQVSMPEH